MITLTPTASDLAPLEYLHTKDTILATKGYIQASDICCLGQCALNLPAFSDLLNPLDKFKNDFFNFTLFVPNGYTVAATLTKIDTGEAYEIIDSTYGDYAAIGTINLNPNVWGFVADWQKISALRGYGSYKFNFKVSNTLNKVKLDEDSPCFDLMPFDCVLADGTVRINANQKGAIEDGFDWTSLSGNNSVFGKYQIRTYGKLSNPSRTIIEDSVQSSRRENLQIQIGTFKNWDLRLDFLPSKVSDLIHEELMLANPIIVDDYNLKNFDDYKGIKLKVLSTDSSEKLNKEEFTVLKLEDYRKATIKRY
jgi:hypothetical protein